MNSNSRNQSNTSSGGAGSGWDFLTNHAHVLLCVAEDPGIRLRDIAAAVGITERGAHKILSELVEEGYVLRERHGRRNRYKVKPELPLRHPLVHDREVGDLLRVLRRPQRSGGQRGRTRSSTKGRATVREGEAGRVARTGAGISAAPAMTRAKESMRPVIARGPAPIGSRKTRIPPTMAVRLAATDM